VELATVGWQELIHTAGVAGSNPASPTIFQALNAGFDFHDNGETIGLRILSLDLIAECFFGSYAAVRLS
jgi:hypothetical protein